MAMPRAPKAMSTLLDMLWLLLLSMPAGLAFSGARSGLLAGGALAGAGAAISWLHPDLSLHAPILAVLVMGAASGSLLGVWVRRQSP